MQAHLFEEVGKALSEIRTKNAGGRVQQVLVGPSHSLDVNLQQLLIGERSKRALAALTRTFAERLLFAAT